MLFNSWQFLVFFPVVTVLWFVLPHKVRWLMLLSASCAFYMAFIPVYILILAATIIVDYFAGIYIENNAGRSRLLFLVCSIIANVGFLAFFKYFNFLNGNFAFLARLVDWNYPISDLRIILPIGLSFHTFQAMSYTIEVYRGHQKAERHFGIYALYVMFYPQLVAGPIERPQNLIHQFYEKHSWDYKRVVSGLQLMLWGFFKKVVIADRLAVVVNHVYGNPSDFTGLPLIMATVFFAFQIYCDFSGYSDIAIGAAQVMGFTLMKNFNRPYFSKSIAEFWKRWHISLSTWFRDYLYISLGGNRVAKWRWQFNLFLTFLISGLWHGASWTYVVWGGLNGLYLISSQWTEGIRAQAVKITGLDRFPLLHRYVKVAVTFSLITFAWVFFRAKNMHDALYVVTHMFTGIAGGISFSSLIFSLGLHKYDLAIASAAICVLIFVHTLQREGSVRSRLNAHPVWVRWPVWYALIMVNILFGYYRNVSSFIYFQF